MVFPENKERSIKAIPFCDSKRSPCPHEMNWFCKMLIFVPLISAPMEQTENSLFLNASGDRKPLNPKRAFLNVQCSIFAAAADPTSSDGAPPINSQESNTIVS